MLSMLMLANLAGCSSSDKSSSDTSQGEDSKAQRPEYKVLTNDDDHTGVYGKAGEVSAYDTKETNYALNVDASQSVHEISDMLYGIFIEDINFAADGGLYAEMVQNRSFEFTKLAAGDERHAWSDVGDIAAEVITGDGQADMESDYLPLNENNPNYITLSNASGERAGIANKGFLDGMAIKEGESYDVSAYLKSDDYKGKVYFALSVNGDIVCESEVSGLTENWKKYEVTLTPDVTASSNVKLEVLIDDGSVDADFISCFPEDTFKGRKNGLRKDLAQKLEELEPAFVRFPGGCVVEGNTLELAYDWKDSIGVGRDGEPLLFEGTYGDVAARKQGQNIWTDERNNNDQNPSYMSYGLGFYEYFLLAEDIGAVGVPVLNCGMHCMAQGHGANPALGSDEFYSYVQDALDLVEFCRGDTSTKWGAVRAAMGHEETFALKYIGIGNENWGDDFFAHYQEFVDAFAKARKDAPEMYGDIELIFTSGTDDGDSGRDMYMYAYNYAKDELDSGRYADVTEFAGLIDHHYYNAPQWFLEHTDYYDEDNYSRDTDSMTSTLYGGGIPVFLGEYAAQSNTMSAALAEAAYMTGLERNGDIVKLAAYAPLFGNLTATHWAPDLIWFSNDTVTCSVNYYVQKIFAKNAGTQLLSSTLEGAEVTDMQRFGGKIGLATWNTAAKYDNVKVVDNDSGEVLAEDDFSSDTLDDWEQATDGDWKISGGELVQSSTYTDTGRFSSTGSALYYGDENWTNYTFTVEATKTDGLEGFMIPFCAGGKDNNYFWNIGGWNNSVTCFQRVKDGVKSDQVSGTVNGFTVKTGQTYKLKIVVTDKNVKCYIDDKLNIDYDLPETNEAEAYQVVSTDETNDIIIKLVNEKTQEKTFAIDLENAGTLTGDADVDTVWAKDLTADNILGRPEAAALTSSQVSGISEKFNYTVPPCSVTVLRVHR